MRAFSEMNPIVCFTTLLVCAGIVMFCMEPVLIVLSLVGAAALWFAMCGREGVRSCLWYALLIVICAAVNPLFNHNGVTVLFVANDLPVTLEAIAYGAGMGAMIAAVLWWFRSFAKIMTSDKLLYIFGSISPKIALILSMTLRYIPLFRRQAQKTNQSQRAMGLYKDDNIPDTVRGGARVFSVMVTWALENGVVTADSMTARGYGVGKRTHFALFRFRAEDALVIAAVLVLGAVTAAGMACGAVGFEWYPAIKAAPASALGAASYVCYGLLVLLPAAIEISEALRWKYLTSAV